MQRRIILSIVVVSIMTVLLAVPSSYAMNAVASIKRAQGSIDIERDDSVLTGRKGLILYDKDLVITHKKSKVTIVFRDGSIIRLFPNTRFLIAKSAETKKGSRRFLNNFMLKMGSFWGKFTKKGHKTVINTPTATCGIKGTAVSFSERNGKLSVSLSSGKVVLSNDDESVDLQPGRMVKNIVKRGSIKNKVMDLPYRITIRPDRTKIQLPKPGRETEISFSVQLVDLKTDQNISKSGSVYVSLDLDKIVFPSNLRLNSRGYARFTATVKPFQDKDYKNGQVEIHAIMDGEEFMNVGSGITVLTYDIPKKRSKTIKIDANTGRIR
ncbi:MAG: FecR domain-containing protein [Proteobacteria bacterium]|nr:FecR domain-containing protein [Pseudomonadota bacterium]